MAHSDAAVPGTRENHEPTAAKERASAPRREPPAQPAVP